MKFSMERYVKLRFCYQVLGYICLFGVAHESSKDSVQNGVYRLLSEMEFYCVLVRVPLLY